MDKYLRKYFDKVIDGGYVAIGVTQKDCNTFSLLISDGATDWRVADMSQEDCDLFLMALDLIGWGYEGMEAQEHYLEFRQEMFNRRFDCGRGC